MEQWARNVLHDGDDLGYPHLSPEQKMVTPSGGFQEDLSSEDELLLLYMSALQREYPMMLKVGKLHYIERDWLLGEFRRKGFWLKPERGRNYQQIPKRMRVPNLKFVSRDKWLRKVRERGFIPPDRVGHRPGKLVLGDGEVFKKEKPNNETWLKYVEEVHGIKRSMYYSQLTSLRNRVYYIIK